MTNHLPYELALELKEAGWPQPVGAEIRRREECGSSVVFGEEIGGFSIAWAYSPSLEELIEACPRELLHLSSDESGAPPFQLMYLNGSWEAFYAYDDGTRVKRRSEIETSPKEAVARLWLALKQTEGKSHEA